jgi:hypothetical protein
VGSPLTVARPHACDTGPTVAGPNASHQHRSVLRLLEHVRLHFDKLSVLGNHGTIRGPLRLQQPARAPPSGDRLCPRFADTVPCFWSHLSTTELALPTRGKSIGLAIGWERDSWSDTTRHSHKRKRFLFNESQTCHHRDLLQRGRYDKTGIAKSPAFTHLWHPRDAPLAGGKLAGRQTSQTNENCLDTYFLLNPSRLFELSEITRSTQNPRISKSYTGNALGSGGILLPCRPH